MTAPSENRLWAFRVHAEGPTETSPCDHERVKTVSTGCALFCRCLLATSLTSVDDCLCPA